MSISYRKRGKKNLWDYRVFDTNKKVIASNSGFRTKREAEAEAISIELKLKQGAIIDKNITFYQLWEKWIELKIKPLAKADTTMNKHHLRGKFIKKYFSEKPAIKIMSSEYQAFILICTLANRKHWLINLMIYFKMEKIGNSTKTEKK